MAATKTVPALQLGESGDSKPVIRQGTFIQTRDTQPTSGASAANVTHRTKSGKTLLIPVIGAHNAGDNDDNDNDKHKTKVGVPDKTGSNEIQQDSGDKAVTRGSANDKVLTRKDSNEKVAPRKDSNGNRKDSNDKVLTRKNSNEKVLTRKDSNDKGLHRRDSNEKVTPRNDSGDKGLTRKSSNEKEAHGKDSNDKVLARKDSKDKLLTRKDSSDKVARSPTNHGSMIAQSRTSPVDNQREEPTSQSGPVVGSQGQNTKTSRGSEYISGPARESNANIGQSEEKQAANNRANNLNPKQTANKAKGEDSNVKQNGVGAPNAGDGGNVWSTPDSAHAEADTAHMHGTVRNQSPTQHRQDHGSAGKQQDKPPGSSSTVRTNTSRQSARAVFRKKDGEPVYTQPDIEETVTPRPDTQTPKVLDTAETKSSTQRMSDTAETKSSTQSMPDTAKSTGAKPKDNNKGLPFATTSVRKKRGEQEGAVDQPEAPAAEGSIENVASKFWERINLTEEENKRLLADNDVLQGKLRHAQDKERKATDENEMLKHEMRDVTSQFHKSKQEGYELRQKISSITAEHKKFIDQLEVQAEGLRKDIEKGKRDVDRMQEENRQKEVELAKVKSDYSVEVAKCTAEIEKCQKLIAEREEMHKDNVELKGKVEMLEKVKTKNASEIEKLTNGITKVRGELEMLKAENEKLRSEKASRQDHEAEIQKSLTEMEQLYEKMLKAKLKAESAQRALETEVDMLKKEKEFVAWDTERLKQQISDLEKRVGTMKSTEDAMQKLIKDKQVHIEDLQKQIVELKHANNKQLEEIEDLKDESKSGKVQIAKYEEIQKAHKKLLDENKRLRTQLAHKTIMETNNDSVRDDLSTKLEQTQEQLDEARERIRRMEGWLDEIYTNRDILGSDVTAHISSISLPDIAQSTISEPSPRQAPAAKKKATVGYGIPYASRLKNKHK